LFKIKRLFVPLAGRIRGINFFLKITFLKSSFLQIKSGHKCAAMWRNGVALRPFLSCIYSILYNFLLCQGWDCNSSNNTQLSPLLATQVIFQPPISKITMTTFGAIVCHEERLYGRIQSSPEMRLRDV
jgi:hypothetical protein